MQATITENKAEKTVGELVVERPSRARIFEKLGIDYCCGGRQPLRAACSESGLNYDQVLQQLQAEAAAPAQGERDWSTASLTDLCDHIEQTHHAYLKEELPRLDFLTAKVASRHGDLRQELVEIREIFVAFKAELDGHMMKEEQILFPLCRQLDTADAMPPMHCGSVNNPIRVMIAEHDNAGDALARFRQLSGDYTPPPEACNTYRALFDALRELEANMHQHVHKENNILFPKASRTEAILSR